MIDGRVILKLNIIVFHVEISPILYRNEGASYKSKLTNRQFFQYYPNLWFARDMWIGVVLVTRS